MSLSKPTHNPPFLATWLLELATPRNQALAGDLLEELRHGRSARWFWRQTLSAVLLACSKALINRAPILLFTTLWCTLVPAWLLTVSSLEARYNLHQRFWQLDWPWSFVSDWGLLLFANLLFIWTGIALFLISHLASSGNLNLRSLAKGILASLPALSTLSAALVVLPGMFIQLHASAQSLPAPQSVLRGHIDLHLAAVLVRLPFFLAILASLGRVASLALNQKAGISG